MVSISIGPEKEEDPKVKFFLAQLHDCLDVLSDCKSFSFNRICLLSSTHLGIDGAFKPAAQVAADEQTACFRHNIQMGFEHLDHKMNEVINLNLQTYECIMNIHNAIHLENSPLQHPPSPRSFSPLNNPPVPSHKPSSPHSTLSVASLPPSPKIPNVNLIKLTPDNSQKEEQPSMQLVLLRL